MKSLLYPAIALMNRLSFGMKFSLISVLFLVPMLVTGVTKVPLLVVPTRTTVEAAPSLNSAWSGTVALPRPRWLATEARSR